MLIDSERAAEGQTLAQDREAFISDCRELGFEICVTERRSLENYLSDRAVKAALGNSYSSLGPFEKLGQSPTRWRKPDSWRIAREMEWEEIQETDVGVFLDRI